MAMIILIVDYSNNNNIITLKKKTKIFGWQYVPKIVEAATTARLFCFSSYVTILQKLLTHDLLYRKFFFSFCSIRYIKEINVVSNRMRSPSSKKKIQNEIKSAVCDWTAIETINPTSRAPIIHRSWSSALIPLNSYYLPNRSTAAESVSHTLVSIWCTLIECELSINKNPQRKKNTPNALNEWGPQTSSDILWRHTNTNINNQLYTIIQSDKKAALSRPLRWYF